ncbi:hypothetical protein L596_001628 [Steinernema carpocapsae]|uniref:Uncharacterized protein n=1 Tax=Steinernema carpocapsae TaxID=34508 RepID=A0A4U8ULL6_STECR|nr:hypothetical protein L596_001628 [Steinernema carpocapsae]
MTKIRRKAERRKRRTVQWPSPPPPPSDSDDNTECLWLGASTRAAPTARRRERLRESSFVDFEPACQKRDGQRRWVYYPTDVFRLCLGYNLGREHRSDSKWRRQQ